MNTVNVADGLFKEKHHGRRLLFIHNNFRERDSPGLAVMFENCNPGRVCLLISIMITNSQGRESVRFNYYVRELHRGSAMVYIDEQPFAWRPGMTLAEIVDLVDEQHFFAVVRLNGKLVARPSFSSTPVPDGSQVVLIPMIAGG